MYLENNTSLTLLHDLDHCSVPPLLPGLLLGSSERARGGISMMSLGTPPEKKDVFFRALPELGKGGATKSDEFSEKF